MNFADNWARVFVVITFLTFGVIALGVSCIAIELIPVSRQAAYWNRCLDNTVKFLETDVRKLDGWDKKAKESLAVSLCNGAVFEPTIKTK